MQSSSDVNPNSKEVISPSAISKLTFPFHLKGHQLEAWMHGFQADSEAPLYTAVELVRQK